MKQLNLKGKRLAVVGSREFDDKQRLYEILTKNLDRIKIIVSGGARGADSLAVEWAADFGVPFLVFPALWKDPFTGQHDRGAGFRRNRYIVEHSDSIMAFWDGVSTGTAHTIKMAEEAGKPVHIIKFTPKVAPVDLAEQTTGGAIETTQTEPEAVTVARVVAATLPPTKPILDLSGDTL